MRIEYEGQVHEFPDTWSQEEIAAALKQVPEQGLPWYYKSDPKEYGGVENFLKGFGSGAVGIYESAALGGAAGLDEEAETPTRQTILDIAKAMKPEGGNPGTVSYDLGNTLGSIAGPLPLGLLGPVGAVAAGGIFGLAGSGEASERARRAGATEEQRGDAALKGLAPGMLDVIPQMRILRNSKALAPLLKKFGAKPIEGIVSRIRSAATTGGIEGAQEVAQETIQNMIQQGYDPTQELVEGLGHAGGYGAAGGAIVQALVDLAIPGKSRGGSPPPPEIAGLSPAPDGGGLPPLGLPGPTDAGGIAGLLPHLQDNGLPKPQGKLGIDPYVDVAFPDGSTTQMRQSEVGTDPEANARRAQGQQRRAQEAEAADQKETQDIESLIAEDKQKEAARQLAAVNKLQRQDSNRLPLAMNQGDTNETAQIEQMLNLDKARELERQQSKMAAQALAEAEPAVQQQLRRDSAMETAAGTVQTRSTKAEHAKRGEIFTEVLGKIKVPDTRAANEAYAKALRKAKVPNPKPTAQEQRLIGSVIAHKFKPKKAEAPTPAVPQTTPQAPTQPVADPNTAQNAAMEAAVAPRQRPQQVPAQASFPGMGKPKGVPPQQAAPTQPTTKVVDTGLLNELGVAKSAPVRKAVLGKDLTKPEDLAFVRKELEVYAANPRVKQLPKQMIPKLFAGLASEQAVMFGPRGGIAKGANQGKPNEPVQAVKPRPEPTGTGVGVEGDRQNDGTSPVGTGQRGAAAGAVAPKQKGLEDTGRSATSTPAGTAAQPDPLAATPGKKAPEKQAGKVSAKQGVTTPAKAPPKKVSAVEVTPSTVTPSLKATPAAKTKPKAKETKPKAKETKPAAKPAATRAATPNKLSPRETEKESYLESLGKRTFDYLKTAKLTKGDRSVLDAVKALPYPNRQPKGLTEDSKRVFEAQRAAMAYLQKDDNPETSIARAVHDVIFKVPDFRNQDKTVPAEEVAYFEHTGKTNAGLFLEWMDAHLSEGVGKYYRNLLAREERALHKFENSSWLQTKGGVLVDEVADAHNAEIAEWKKLDTVLKKIEEVDGARLEVTDTAVQYGADLKVSDGKSAKGSIDEMESGLFDSIVEKSKTVSPDRKGAFKTLSDRAYELLIAAGGKDYRKKVREMMKRVEDFSIVSEAVDSLQITLHPSVVESLMDGNLKQALIRLHITAATDPVYKLADTDIAVVKDVARKFANLIGDTKVKVVPNLINERGTKSPGVYDPKTNTIRLDKDTANVTHVLLHEVAHALTVSTLTNKSHPLTKQLNRIYNDSKRGLRSEYGAQSLEEFVAEAYSNVDFQKQLATILDKGVDTGTMTMWDRFVDAVTGFMWKMVGKGRPREGTSFAEFRHMTDAILAPAPEYVNHTELELASIKGKAKELHDAIGASYYKASDALGEKNHSKMEATVQNIAGGWLGIPAAMKWVVAGSLPSFPLAEVTSRVYKLKQGKQLHDLFNKMDGDIHDVRENLDSTVRELDTFGKENPEAMKILGKLHTQATIESVDPDPIRRHVRKDENGDVVETKIGRRKYGKEKAKVFDEMQEQWQAITPQGQKLYREVREGYQKLHDEMEKALEERIDDLVQNEQTAGKIKSEIRNELFKRDIDPYFPLSRSGQYWLEFYLEGDGDPVRRSFETKEQRKKFTRQIEANVPELKAGSVRNMDTITEFTTKGAPPSDFVADILTTLRATKDNLPEGTSPEVKKNLEEQTQEVMRLFIQRLPESAYAKTVLKRRNISGFDEDILLGFRRRALPTAREISRVRFTKLINKALLDMKEETIGLLENGTNEQPTQEYQALVKEWTKRATFATNPPHGPMAQFVRGANRFAFLGTLGFNVSSAAVNLGQIPMFVAPYLSAETTFGSAMSALNAGRKLFMASPTNYTVHNYQRKGDERNVQGAKLSKSLSNFFTVQYDKNGKNGRWVLRDDMEITDEEDFWNGHSKKDTLRMLARLQEEMHKHAQDNRSIFYEMLEVDELNNGGLLGNTSETINMWSAYIFHQAERFNRQITAVGSYLNTLERMENEPTAEERGMDVNERMKAAAENAVDVVHRVNGGTQLTTTMRFAQQGPLRVGLMFKAYGVNMYYHLFSMAAKAIGNMGATAAEQKIAQKQFVGTIGSIGLLTGVSGVIPFYNLIAQLADLFFNDDDDLDFDAQVRRSLHPIMYHGVLNKASSLVTGGEGAALSQRMGIGSILWQSNRYNFDPSVEKSIVSGLGGPFYGYTSSIGRGVADIAKGNLGRGIEGMLPAAFRNVLRSGRYATEGALTRRGDPIMDDVGPGLLASQFFGFAPAEYVRNQERNQILKGIDRAVNDKRTMLLRKLYVGLRLGDDVHDVMEDVAKFNAKWPQHRIDPASIRSSIKKHISTSQNMHNGVLFSPKMQQTMKMMSADFDA